MSRPSELEDPTSLHKEDRSHFEGTTTDTDLFVVRAALALQPSNTERHGTAINGYKRLSMITHFKCHGQCEKHATFSENKTWKERRRFGDGGRLFR